ncbi:MAG: heavy metal-responsive transcriptional regulator [Acidobacteria bacterium]|nr:MAG: heavy metal-responsive transcriptional regulator [Acidobacteriota bacterium]
MATIQGAFIGEVSRQTGLSVHTIRFYEAEGLLQGAARTNAGYRIYSPEIVEQLHFIRKAQELGFSLKEIRDLLILRDRRMGVCSHVKSLVEEKLASVSAKLRELEAIEKDLKAVLAQCKRQLKRHSRSREERCPVLVRLGRSS